MLRRGGPTWWVDHRTSVASASRMSLPCSERRSGLPRVSTWDAVLIAGLHINDLIICGRNWTVRSGNSLRYERVMRRCVTDEAEPWSVDINISVLFR